MRVWLVVVSWLLACEPNGIHIEWQLIGDNEPVRCADIAPTHVAVSTFELFGRQDYEFDCDDGSATFEPAVLGEETDYDVTVDLVGDDGTFVDRGLATVVHHADDTRTELPPLAFRVAGPALFSWTIQDPNGEVACGAVGASTVRVVIAGLVTRDFSCDTHMGEIGGLLFGTYQIDASLLRATGSVVATVSKPGEVARGFGGVNVGFGFVVP